MSLLPTFFISHGGGPWSYMQGQIRELSKELEDSLRKLPEEIGEPPKAILVVSGHWEELQFTVMATVSPPMIYDYSGFPDYTYRIQYHAPGAPEIALRVQELAEPAGFQVRSDDRRGFDHGVYAPLHVSFPAASVPVLQLSLRRDLDPRAHLAIGRALRPLRGEGVLIVGSGSSYHNLRDFFSPAAGRASAEFDGWLNDALCAADPSERAELLANWKTAPSALSAHPREEHLIPLMVAAGAAEGERASRIFSGKLGDVKLSNFRFGS